MYYHPVLWLTSRFLGSVSILFITCYSFGPRKFTMNIIDDIQILMLALSFK